MKQRINIAAALLSDPEILLLDEPTIGLDPRGMAEDRDIVHSLKKRNRLIFVSSHLLPEVSDVCEVAIIDHGKLIVYDSLAALHIGMISFGASDSRVGCPGFYVSFQRAFQKWDILNSYDAHSSP